MKRPRIELNGEGLDLRFVDCVCRAGKALPDRQIEEQDQARTAEARSLLQPVYDRFSEGFGTADLKTAKAYLDT